MPFFSIVIPLFNKGQFIENTLESIFKQTFSDYEIIIVDDVSTDESLSIARRFESEKVRIIEHQKNRGLSASRNTGIQNASADYIAFLDADDLWKTDYLQKIHSLIQQFPEANLFATNYEELYPDDVVVATNNNVALISDGIITDFFESSLAQPIYCSCSLCVAKPVFETIGYFNENITFGEDVDFNIRANSAYKLAYSIETLVIYRIFSEQQITLSGLKNKTITDFDSYEPSENNSLKKYLDVNRYIMARQYKCENESVNFNKMKNGINRRNLNKSQLFLLNLPAAVDRSIKRFKTLLIKKGVRFTSFS